MEEGEVWVEKGEGWEEEEEACQGAVTSICLEERNFWEKRYSVRPYGKESVGE